MAYVKIGFSVLWKCYVGIVFSVLAVCLYPFFWLLLTRHSWKKKSFKLFLVWSWLMRIFCFYHVRKIQQVNLPEGPYIIISNHTSYLDIFFMYSIMPNHPFLFMGKGEILNYPLIKTYFKGLNIPVHRANSVKAARSFIQAKQAIEEGWSIVIFPEGGIPNHTVPKMVPFKNGAFKLAKSVNIPIIPITFENNHILFSDPMDFKGSARPGVSLVHIHPFLSTEYIQSHDEQALLDACFQTINEPLLKRI
jgi:1-acyl-sn-glycerol-3-phosphate acyltransferase